MSNRIASIIFARQLMKQGIKACNMEDLMSELPEGTTIVGFGEDPCRNIMQINVSHEKFKEVSIGSIIPEIVAKFTVDEDGVEDCELDLSDVLEDGYKIDNNRIVDEFSYHHIDAFRYMTSNLTAQNQGRVIFNCNTETQKSISDSWWNNDDFGKYDPSKKDEKKCEHEWKKVTGINKYYVICEHCGERNEEEEKKQWE